MTQGLAKILIILVQAHLRSGIQETADSDGCIDHETRQIIGRRAKFALQSIVDHHGGGTQIREKIADAGARRRRDRPHIGARYGLDDGAIDRVIDPVYAAIP
jgi:hypothetical protein